MIDSLIPSLHGGGCAVAYPTEEFHWPQQATTCNGDIEKKLDRLANEWRTQTAHWSSAAKMAMHPSYQQIVGMGEKVLPFLLRRLKNEPDHWFWALNAITGTNPVARDHQGDLEAMAGDWIEWGKNQKLLD